MMAILKNMHNLQHIGGLSFLQEVHDSGYVKHGLHEVV